MSSFLFNLVDIFKSMSKIIELFTDVSSRVNYYQKSMFVDKDVLRNRKLNEIL